MTRRITLTSAGIVTSLFQAVDVPQRFFGCLQRSDQVERRCFTSTIKDRPRRNSEPRSENLHPAGRCTSAVKNGLFAATSRLSREEVPFLCKLPIAERILLLPVPS